MPRSARTGSARAICGSWAMTWPGSRAGSGITRDVSGVMIDDWLRSLDLAPRTRNNLRASFQVLFNSRQGAAVSGEGLATKWRRSRW